MIVVIYIALLCATLTLQDKTFLTFNVGLTRTVPLYEERQVPVVDALRNEEADVLCIQEAWHGIDINNIISGLRSKYQYSYSDLHQSDGTVEKGPACTEDDNKFLQCAEANCFLGGNPVNTVKCTISNCSLMDLSQRCRSCIMLSEPVTASITKDCFTAEHHYNVYGLLLLSKHQIFSVELIDYEPNTKRLAPRGYIKAQIKGIGEIICTHLTVDLGPDYLETHLDQYNSWKEQNFAEIQMLVNEVKYKKYAIVMGTLNTGPNITSKSVVGDFPESYKELTKAGLKSGYVDLVGDCNLCQKNPFNLGYIAYDSIANHVLTKGYTPKSAKIRFTDNIPGRVYPLSYHYGVELTLPEYYFDPFRSIYTGFNFLYNPELKDYIR